MIGEIFLFSVVATTLTFAAVLLYATSKPNLSEKDIKNGSWGNYAQAPQAPLTTRIRRMP